MSEITVELSPKHPMHLATDPQSTRLALSGVIVEPSNDPKRVIYAATNSRILAVVKEEGTCKEPTIAPAECFKAKKGETLAVAKNGRWEKSSWKMKRGVREGVTNLVLADVEGRFPRYRDALPNIEWNRTLAVTIDPQYLLDLQQALRGDSDKRGITLLIPYDGECPTSDAGNAIACIVEDGGIGAIMPLAAGDCPRGQDHQPDRAYYTEFVKSLGETPKT